MHHVPTLEHRSAHVPRGVQILKTNWTILFGPLGNAFMVVFHMNRPTAATFITMEKVVAPTKSAYATLITVEDTFDLSLVVVQGTNATVV